MKEISVGQQLTPTVKTTLYTVPKNYYVKWNLLYAGNHTSSAKEFSAWWYDKSTNNEIGVVVDYPLDAKEFLKFDGGAYVVLDEGDEVRVQVAANAVCGVICTFELIQKTSGKLGASYAV